MNKKKEALRIKNGSACKDTCERMLSNYNPALKTKAFNTNGSGYISIAKEDKSKRTEIDKQGKTYIESLANDAYLYQDTAEKAYNYILEQLNLNKPLVVGVDLKYNVDKRTGNTSTKEAGYNHDKTTDHFIVIVGKGMENGVPYLEYLDPGTQNGIKSKSNRLYPLWKAGEMYWYDPKASWLADGTYCITAVCLFE